MRILQIYLIFHLAAGLPLCWRALRGQGGSWRRIAFRWTLAVVAWPIPAAAAFYEVIRDIRKERRNA